MRKAVVVSLLALGVISMTGCKPEEHSTATFLGIDKSYIKTTVSSEDGKTDGYSITAVINHGERTNVVDVVVADKIYPPTSNAYQITIDKIIRQALAKTVEYPLTFTEKQFPPEPKGTVETQVSYDGPSGKIEPCIQVADDISKSVYCSGYGMVRKSLAWKKQGADKTALHEMIYFKDMAGKKVEEFEPEIATHISSAYTMLLPEADRKPYLDWVKACPDHVQTKNHEPLSPIASAVACSCVFKAERPNVDTIVEFADSPNPLGNGEGAEAFYTKVRQCVGD